MPRSENQRLKLLYIKDYLLENTDENHTVNASDIIDHLQKTYNISSSRNTIYTDIDMLEDYGVDVKYDATLQGYRVIQRDFELYEVQLLIDSVQSSKFITQKIAKEISNKLKNFASKYERKILERQNYVHNRIRSINDSVFYGIDDIHASIANNCKISFKYFTYTVKKEKSYRKKIYVVSPFALVWNDSNYYLVAYESGIIKHFRVDKMDNITALSEEREGTEEFKAINLSERSTKVFSMYSGKEERVGLCFSNHLVGVVIDRFGKDIMIMPNGQNHFTINVAIEISPQFFGWLCGFGQAVKIISPDTVIKQMNDYILAIAEVYKTDSKT